MAVEWTDSFTCSKCNVSRKVVKELEQGIDPDTKNPYQKMELECGHIQKRLRVSKEFTFLWNINQGEKLKVEPAFADGIPSLAVSSGSHTTVVGGQVKIGFAEGANNNIINVNVINAINEGESNIIQDLSKTQINLTYNEILKQIDKDITNENERQEIKNILQEIKNDLNSKRIPDSGLFQKLKRYENVYNAILPWATRVFDLIIKNALGQIN